MKKNTIFNTFPIAIAIFSYGCNKTNTPAESSNANKNNVLRYALTTNPATLDPAKVEDQDTYDTIMQCYDNLMEIDQEGNVVPQLAEKIEASDDAKTYTITLKKGVYFHNTNKELTAEDVEWSLNRACNPKLASPVADSYLGIIEGVQDRLAGKSESISGVKVLDKYTVQFTLKEPAGYFPGMLCYPVSSPLPKGLVPETEIKDVKDAIGTGPFQLTNYVPNTVVNLVANKKYHNSSPFIEGIDKLILPDSMTRLNKYRMGGLDFLNIERQDIESVQRDPVLSKQLRTYPRPSLFFVGLNNNNPALADVRVRQALAMTVDKNYLVNKILGGTHIPATGLLVPGFPGYREEIPDLPKFNPEKAQELLKEAGYGPGLKKLEFTLSFRNDKQDIRMIAEALHGLWKNYLGVDVKIQPMEWSSFIQKLDQKTHSGVLMRWLNDYPDPQNTISLMFSSKSESNWFGYNNPEVDELCRLADVSTKQNERIELYQKAEDQILRDSPWIPVYVQQDAILMNPRVEGLKNSPFHIMPHTTVKLNSTN